MKKEFIKEFEDWANKNSDSYGKACVDVARRAMEILDECKDFETHALIVQADKAVHGQSELTGYMAGVIASAITHFHERGAEFNKKWNKDNGGTGEEKGTINPAILTIKNAN